METALIAVCVAPLAAAGGFVAGVRYSARRIPDVLAAASPEVLRGVARRTAEKRKANAA